MTRAFTDQPLPLGTLESLVELASRAPSAGKTQGWHLVALEGADTHRFWDLTLPSERRSTFAWPELLLAPVILLPFADPEAYVERYNEPDKTFTGLGESVEAWPTPYWTIDASMALMTLLHAAEDAGLGSLLFAVFHGAAELRAELCVPEHLVLLGAVALGWPKSATPSPGPPGGDSGTLRRGRSANRPRRAPEQILHRGQW